MLFTCKKLTIFEGCNGSGKTTAAIRYAEETNARLVHFNDLPRVGAGLARMYAEAMIPALLGYQDVVFDRCWLSEAPYGAVLREGTSRLTRADCRMLERLAMKCGAVVVYCDPGWDEVMANFIKSSHSRIIYDVMKQMKIIHNLYRIDKFDLPSITYDYTEMNYEILKTVDQHRYLRHPWSLNSAGNWKGEVLLIGDKFANHKKQDLFYQWPFASFSDDGCSRWLTDELINFQIRESRIAWVNADQPLEEILKPERKLIIAFGDNAYDVVRPMCDSVVKIEHPQYWKRFKSDTYFPLYQQFKLKGVL
jgi:hypothetical protein